MLESMRNNILFLFIFTLFNLQCSYSSYKKTIKKSKKDFRLFKRSHFKRFKSNGNIWQDTCS